MGRAPAPAIAQERPKLESHRGILITLDTPTKPMRDEAASAGRFELKLWQKDYPKSRAAILRA